jgi:hypothetical protein
MFVSRGCRGVQVVVLQGETGQRSTSTLQPGEQSGLRQLAETPSRQKPYGEATSRPISADYYDINCATTTTKQLEQLPVARVPPPPPTPLIDSPHPSQP